MPHDDKEDTGEYRVVTAENKVERLIKDVNKLMDSGWQPLGGVSVSHVNLALSGSNCGAPNRGSTSGIMK